QPAAGVVVGVAPGADRPARARRIMIAQVLADAGQRLTDLDAERLQALGLADARQLEQLGRVDRAAAHHDVAPGSRLALRAVHRIAHADAALAVEQQAVRHGAGLDVQVGPLADGIEIGARRAYALAAENARLAHGDAVLSRAVVVGIVPDADLGRRRDQRLEDRLGRLRIGDGERAVAAAIFVLVAAPITSLVALDALEERQHLAIAPAG